MADPRIPETSAPRDMPHPKKKRVNPVFLGIAVLPALLSAVISVAIIRSGFPVFFFLVPVGFMAYGYNRRSAWTSALLAAGGNGVISLGWTLVSPGTGAYLWLNLLYFTMMLLVFTWIVGPPFHSAYGFLSTAYRLIIGSGIGVLTCWYIIEVTRDSQGFTALLKSQAELFSSLSIASAGTDVVQRSLLEQQLDPEALIAQFGSIALRGGGLAACGVVFFINRQLSLVCVGLIRRIRVGNGLIQFHAVPGLIWVLSLSLLGVLGGTITGIAPLEIAAWNMVTICALLYLAQGGGIVLYILSQRSLPPLIRVGLNILLIILICSPKINLLALGALGILGIAEHWLPFRVPKSDGSSSTPGM